MTGEGGMPLEMQEPVSPSPFGKSKSEVEARPAEAPPPMPHQSVAPPPAGPPVSARDAGRVFDHMAEPVSHGGGGGMIARHQGAGGATPALSEHADSVAKAGMSDGPKELPHRSAMEKSFGQDL